jgi:hypothetical protein
VPRSELQVRLKSIRGGTPFGEGYHNPVLQGWWCHVAKGHITLTPSSVEMSQGTQLSLANVARVERVHQPGEGYFLGWGCEWSVKLEGHGVYLYLCCEDRYQRDTLSLAIATLSGEGDDRAALYEEDGSRISLPRKWRHPK